MARFILVVVTVTAAFTTSAADPKPQKPVARLFYRDHDARQVKWADVQGGDGGKLTLGPVAAVTRSDSLALAARGTHGEHEKGLPWIKK